MSNTNNTPQQTTEFVPIPQPAEILDGETVRNVYEQPVGSGSPDFDSKAVMERYLQSRYVQEEPVQHRVIWHETGKTIPSVTRIPDGTKTVTRFERTDEYWVSKKLSAIVVVGSLALFNAGAIGGTINSAAQRAGHKIYRVFNPVEDVTKKHTHVSKTPGGTKKFSVKAGVKSSVGQAEIDTVPVDTFVAKVKDTLSDHPNSKAVVDNTGIASGEWNNDSSIPEITVDNEALAKARGAVTDALLTERFGETPGVSIISTSEERNPSEAVSKELLEKALQSGFPDIMSAIRAVDNGESVNPELAELIKTHITSQRGSELEATISWPGEARTKTKVTTEIVPGEDNPPQHGPIKWRPWFIPLPPIRKRQRISETRQKSRWKFVPRKPILKPEIITENKEHVWVRLRDEALQESGSLVKNPWAYTRKFENLMREDRIHDILKASFTNSKNVADSLRVMFVDHSPAAETIEMFEGLLEKFAAMQGGNIANRITGIFVYPTKNTGLRPRNPRRIGLGVDKQDQSNILGTCTPILELVEMHMTDSLNPDTLNEMFAEFSGPKWVAAHEVAGHATDLKKLKPMLKRIKTSAYKNAHIIVGSTWRDNMHEVDQAQRDLPRYPSPSDVVQFDITYQTVDKNGAVETINQRVNHDDLRLQHALSSTIVDRKPTQYANTHSLENYAETAASVTTGIEIPYEQAGVQPPENTEFTYTQTYRPATSGQNVFTNAVGAVSDEFPIAFKDKPKVTFTHINPANDKLLQAEMRRARSNPTPRPDDMVSVLARVIRQEDAR